MPEITNNLNFDAFADDEYQSQEFIKKPPRERTQVPFASVDDFKVFNRAIFNDNNLNPLFKELFK
jgi:hypothetical protein|tara:strand:+ start:213 stop:407 length:195 start_codon:yes stop_codon:yes gene_type:complete